MANNITTDGVRRAMGNHIGDILVLGNGLFTCRIEKIAAKNWRLETSRGRAVYPSMSLAVGAGLEILAASHK